MGQVMRLAFGKGSASISNHPILPTLFFVQDSAQPYGTGIHV